MESQRNLEEKARLRAEIILKVRGGEITATEGAERLGVSRKTYYEWEGRGLAGMLDALEDEQPGRPPLERNPEKEAMEARIRQLEQELEVAKKSEVVRRVFAAWELQKAKDRKRNERSKKK